MSDMNKCSLKPMLKHMQQSIKRELICTSAHHKNEYKESVIMMLNILLEEMKCGSKYIIFGLQIVKYKDEIQVIKDNSIKTIKDAMDLYDYLSINAF